MTLFIVYFLADELYKNCIMLSFYLDVSSISYHYTLCVCMWGYENTKIIFKSVSSDSRE